MVISWPIALPGGKQFCRNVCANVCDPRGALVFRLGNKTAFFDVAIFDVYAVGSRAGDKDVFENFIAALDLRRSASGSRADLADERGALFQVFVIVEGQLFVAPLGRSDGVSVFEVFERIESLDGERLGADTGDFLINVAIESFDKRDDDHEGSNADNHAQQRQGRAQLMRPDRCYSKF